MLIKCSKEEEFRITEIKFIFIWDFPYPKNGRSVSVTVKEQVTNTAHNMTLLNTHMCVRVEKRMEGQTPKDLQWLFLDFVRKGGLNCLLCSLPQFSKMFAMSPEICLSQIKNTHWKKLLKRTPLRPKVKNSLNSASYHKGIQSWSERRWRCAWKHLPLPHLAREKQGWGMETMGTWNAQYSSHCFHCIAKVTIHPCPWVP